MGEDISVRVFLSAAESDDDAGDCNCCDDDDANGSGVSLFLIN